jgi:hypothetical protein
MNCDGCGQEIVIGQQCRCCPNPGGPVLNTGPAPDPLDLKELVQKFAKKLKVDKIGYLPPPEPMPPIWYDKNGRWNRPQKSEKFPSTTFHPLKLYAIVHKGGGMVFLGLWTGCLVWG